MGASSQSTDFQIFRFGERPIGDIEAALRQVGMFAPKRAIWLRAFAEGKRKQAADTDDDETDDNEEGEESAGGPAALLALLEGGIPRETLFVISAPALDARGRLFKWFAKNADVVDRRIQVEQRGKLKEDSLRRAIGERLEELGVKKIGTGAIDAIVKRSGSVLGETMQEVDRLVLAQSDPSRLDAKDVENGMRDLALGWVFDFTSALEKRDLAAAENLIARLLADGEPPLRLSALLASHVARLADARPIVDS